MSTRKLHPIRVQTIQSKWKLWHFIIILIKGIAEFDRSKYTCSQIHVKSHDDKQIPVTLIHQKNIKLNGRYYRN